ncbi:Endoribonuclease Dicer homolog 2 [Linum perenne]
MYWGEMGVDFWDAAIWKHQIDTHEVLVMTPQILLNALRHSFFKLEFIKVLILDECHHTSGKHPYACIMKEFYHPMLISNSCDIPRIFGMTASLIKSKCRISELDYWDKIKELETIMHSKVYTCVSESVISEYVPIPTAEFRFYDDVDVPSDIYGRITTELNMLKTKHESSLGHLDLTESSLESTRKKLSRTHYTLLYCLYDLGLWLAYKAATFMSSSECVMLWDKLDASGERSVKKFSLDASKAFENCISAELTIGGDAMRDENNAFISTKVYSLLQSLLDRRNIEDIRCIIFVERVITSVVLQSLLSDLLPQLVSWKTEYIAGNRPGSQNQTRKTQNNIVEEFRKGTVNIIVATSILEEGLDVQSCNLVIRFDPSATVSSFIQSRGRARMQNSEYLLMVKRGDISTQSRLEKYLSSGEIMRSESLRHASTPCSPLGSELSDEEETYRVESTGAVVTSAYSIELIYFYCSRLPSDGYFKPAPLCVFDKETGSCTLYLPKSCPLPPVCVEGDIKSLKQKVCLEACIQLHKIGALTDNLVPDTVAEKLLDPELGEECYDDDHPVYFPPDFVRNRQLGSNAYYCYLIKLSPQFDSEIHVQDIFLVICNELETDVISSDFSLQTDRGTVAVTLSFIGHLDLKPMEVERCRRFQMTILNVLINHTWDKLKGNSQVMKQSDHLDYFLLPAVASAKNPTIDWRCVSSVLFSYNQSMEDHKNCMFLGNARYIETKDGPACKCMLQNSLVYTPHNQKLYCIWGVSDELTGNSILSMRDGESLTYKDYYKKRHGLKLCLNEQSLLSARQVFPVLNLLLRCKQKIKEKESRNAYVDLPPELCSIVMSPISISTFYSFTFVPSIMHRLESLLVAFNLKKMHLDSMHNVVIPSEKVLEAITTKTCQEKIHLESLETLGDSFLKYTACQHLFRAYQNHHEGLLSIKKDRIVSNASLFSLGYNIKLPGFIRDAPFDPKTWMIPGSKAVDYSLSEELLPNAKKIFIRGTRKMKRKKVADVVEALIGAYLSVGGETATLLFMNWIGIRIDFTGSPSERHFQLDPEKLVNVHHMESLLNYSFNDRSLLVEALTHGSYMLPEIPRCYQRLEFLGDSVLDYLITVHLYNKYPNISPGLLTDMRSASVNNECYAQSAIRNGLHKHILHASKRLHNDISRCIADSKDWSSGHTFGWESETSYPKVLGDIMEALGGAILVDSGYDKEVVFRSMIRLLEPLVTPETLRLEPVRELNELCQREHLVLSTPVVVREDGVTSITMQVEANNGAIFSHKASATDKKMAKRLASREILKALRKSGLLKS